MAPPPGAPQRLFVFSGSFLWKPHLRRALLAAGYEVTTGLPQADDLVGVWGNTATAQRGLEIAERSGARVLRIEDAFIRSLHPGRDGEAPLGLLIDDLGLHFDPKQPSRLERILADDPLDDGHLLARARDGMARMRAGAISKYSGHDAPPTEPGYVLVVDQLEGDASVRASGGTRASFLEMLYYAQEEHPGARIVVKSHPETAQGHRAGHLDKTDLPPGAQLLQRRVDPWALVEGAVAVYTLSSQMGFEAILAGHRPVVFGQPFYAGWGLSDDRQPLDRRQRQLTRAQLFAGAMIQAPVWVSPYHGTRCSFEETLAAMEAQSRAWREDHIGWSASGMRLWKRPHLQRFFGRHRAMRFGAPQTGRRHMVWGRGDGDARCEDGFIRSRGLGAQLVPPLSLVLDQTGIYYDPTRPSDLDALIRKGAPSDLARHRAERLALRLVREGISKYNHGAPPPPLPDGHKILVVGQVEDDASIRLGALDINTNRALLEAARAAHPDAVILWKPHPDVEAGLRPGAVPGARDLADLELSGVDPAALLGQVDALWTMTSLMGFEALLRGVPVTCAGQPFYAGWGLTRDLLPAPAHRGLRVELADLIWATLIAYPRYLDPVSGLPCPPEIVLDRLHEGLRQPRRLKLLAKLQGVWAGLRR